MITWLKLDKTYFHLENDMSLCDVYRISYVQFNKSGFI